MSELKVLGSGQLLNFEQISIRRLVRSTLYLKLPILLFVHNSRCSSEKPRPVEGRRTLFQVFNLR
jgi:hypothetical protein